MSATPEPLKATQNPLDGILRSQASRDISIFRIAAKSFSALGAALVSAVAHRIPQCRLPPRDSAGSGVSLVTLLSIR